MVSLEEFLMDLRVLLKLLIQLLESLKNEYLENTQSLSEI